MAILTNGGGPGVIASDALEAYGLSLAEISEKTKKGLSALLPPAASLANPVDMLGGATHTMYAGCLQLLLADPGVDGVLVILPPPPADTAEADARAMIPLIQSSKKPAVVALMGGRTIQEASELFREAHIPEYRFPERAVSALSSLVRRAEFLMKVEAAPPSWMNIDHNSARAALANAKPGAFLDAEAADGWMSAGGIPTAPVRLARTAEQAAKIAAGLGFPVVLKIASPDITHKSDVGGVLLDVKTEAEAFAGFLGLTGRVQAARPDARIEGVHIQPLLPEGQDVIIGAARDRVFGPLMMFGSGGVEVEALKDVAFALAPLHPTEADDLLRGTWAGRRLAGYRSLPPADEKAVKEILQRLSQLMVDFPQVAEAEINPLRVLGNSAVAVDVRVRIGENGK